MALPQGASDEQRKAPAKAGAPDFAAPEWAGPATLPSGIAVELIVNGQVRKRLPLAANAERTESSKQTQWSFLVGRASSCDVCLEGLEPKASRFHAVLQCRTDEPVLYVYDLGSSHGTMVNGRRLDPRVYTPVRVGEQLRFCAESASGKPSSCLAVLSGPSEAMAEEGDVDLTEFRERVAQERAEHEKAMEDDLTQRKEAKRQKLNVEAQRRFVVTNLAARARNDMQELREAEEGDRQKLHEVTWGLSEDAVEQESDITDEGQKYLDAHGHLDLEQVKSLTLTEKQVQMTAKVDQKQRRIANLNKEKSRLETKSAGGGKRKKGEDDDFFADDDKPGVNEKDMEQLHRVEEKLDKAEEELGEMTANLLLSLGMKKAGKAARQLRKRRAEFFDTSLGTTEDDEDFFDRTAAKSSTAVESGDRRNGRCRADSQEEVAKQSVELVGLPTFDGVETLESLEAKKVILDAERARLLVKQVAEEAKERQRTQAQEEEDELDAFMAANVAELHQDRRAQLQRRLAGVDTRLKEAQVMLRVARRNSDNPSPATASTQSKKAQAGSDSVSGLESREGFSEASKKAKPGAERPGAALVAESAESSTAGSPVKRAKRGPERPPPVLLAAAAQIDSPDKRGSELPPASVLKEVVPQCGAAALPAGSAALLIGGAALKADASAKALLTSGAFSADAAAIAGDAQAAVASMPKRLAVAPARGLIDPDRAGLQRPLGARAMPPPPPPKVKKVIGAAPPPPGFLRGHGSRDADLAASGESAEGEDAA